MQNVSIFDRREFSLLVTYMHAYEMPLTIDIDDDSNSDYLKVTHSDKYIKKISSWCLTQWLTLFRVAVWICAYHSQLHIAIRKYIVGKDHGSSNQYIDLVHLYKQLDDPVLLYGCKFLVLIYRGFFLREMKFAESENGFIACLMPHHARETIEEFETYLNDKNVLCSVLADCEALFDDVPNDIIGKKVEKQVHIMMHALTESAKGHLRQWIDETMRIIELGDPETGQECAHTILESDEVLETVMKVVNIWFPNDEISQDQFMDALLGWLAPNSSQNIQDHEVLWEIVKRCKIICVHTVDVEAGFSKLLLTSGTIAT